MQKPRSKLLAQAARAHLAPLGAEQRGRSRTWLDDRGWFVTVIEFQPSGFSQGTYLNVGAHFLWRWSGTLSFDLGYRREALVAYEDDTQFAREAERLASRAAAEMLTLRERLREPQDVVSHMPRAQGWPSYHRAVSFGLSDRVRNAVSEFRFVDQPSTDDPAWLVDLRSRCRSLADLVSERETFRVAVLDMIAKQRVALKLATLKDPLAR